MAFPSPTKVFHDTAYASILPTRPELSSAGRVIVITGGGAGLGPTIAASFAEAGSTAIAILGRTQPSLSLTKASLEVSHPGLRVLPLVADITDTTAVNAAFSAIKTQLGPIDVLVSNAAYMPDKAAIANADVTEWWRGMEVNVKGNFNLAQAFLANRAEKGVVFISITTGGAHFPGAPLTEWSGYMVSKVAAIKLMDFLAEENPDVRVHQLHPGVLTGTEMADKGVAGGLSFPADDMSLPGGVAVWTASPEAEFMRSRIMWANWDVDELMAKKAGFEADPSKFKLGLLGCHEEKIYVNNVIAEHVDEAVGVF